VSFARDPGTLAYYERQAAEYDEWYAGEGLFAARERPGWDAEVAQIISLVAALPAARTLDVACGTAFLTQHVQGFVVGLDQSSAMVAKAQERLPNGLALQGDALHLPFADNAFDRVLTGHFYGHLAAEVIHAGTWFVVGLVNGFETRHEATNPTG
jgi:ubiquinone/menaquinone biosynthesis C-methylase UbiE